ncbi:NYN domain-containing protein [Persicobacter sp. CCB-QB2]|uniref:NYN domain-containing protein n=1 Tax=Persicobacter sp. CCB-QB2 TaxID=1561025 RepID=UPI0006A9B3C5|nr:NYN domain-containing protein [Persicobacter sp. CCB-QB2]
MKKINTDRSLAVLIDADNVSSAFVSEMMEEIARFGLPTTRRIYGDWTRPNLSGWKSVLLENAINPVQQYSYTQGKNATDSAMIIDAMDILYSGKVDGFCIVSSDSDFTRLATRLRESGMWVMGVGEQKTPKPFIVACNKFVYLEVLKKDSSKEENKASGSKEESLNRINQRLISLLQSSVDDVSDDSGWANLGEFGSLLSKKRPDFDARNYGFSKLMNMIKFLSDYFELDERVSDQDSAVKHVYLRSLRKKEAKRGRK